MRSCMNRSPTKKNKEIKYRRKRKNKENQKKVLHFDPRRGFRPIFADSFSGSTGLVGADKTSAWASRLPANCHSIFVLVRGKIKWDSIFVFRRKCAQWLCLHLSRLVFVMLSKWDSQDTKSGSREVEWSSFAGCKKRFFFRSIKRERRNERFQVEKAEKLKFDLNETKNSEADVAQREEWSQTKSKSKMKENAMQWN